MPGGLNESTICHSSFQQLSIPTAHVGSEHDKSDKPDRRSVRMDRVLPEGAMTRVVPVLVQSARLGKPADRSKFWEVALEDQLHLNLGQVMPA